jgi:hypothetical protein
MTKRDEAAARGRQAAEMRREGKPWNEIAEALGYSHPGGAFQAARRHGAVLFTVKKYAPRSKAAAE